MFNLFLLKNNKMKVKIGKTSYFDLINPLPKEYFFFLLPFFLQRY